MKWVYGFSQKEVDGNKEMKAVLGGKGANLAEMCSLGLPVPPGFTVSTEACLNYFNVGGKLSQEVKDQVKSHVRIIENLIGKEFGNLDNPLLFSVRSGARVSMPGMMDTVLNLGLNDQTVIGLANATQNERFAWDSYRRFIQMYSNVVLGVHTSLLDSTLEDLKEAREIQSDTDLTTEDLKELVQVFKSILLQELGHSFPQDVNEQLWMAIGAVFKSWQNPRAKKYRQLHNIPDDWGTAVNVQSMVFGNKGITSATGVAFTRHPSTGEKIFFGEYLLNAQGEDVVAGIRTPGPVNHHSKTNGQQESLEEVMPKVYKELEVIYKKLEAHYQDMQDIEFTVENNVLYILQTRNGKRTTAAAVQIAVDMVKEGLIDKKEAIKRIRPEDLNQLLHPKLDPNAKKKILGTGLPASPGAVTGRICLDSELAQKYMQEGKKCLLIREETSPEDIAGMAAAEGILTARGGMTSHAAVVARGMGKTCIAGCNSLFIDLTSRTIKIGDLVLNEGDYLTLDGQKGEILEGEVPTIKTELSGPFREYMAWADEFKRLKIRTNADTPNDTQTALSFGAEGIGLCRTEHMFFDNERILAVRQMIFAENKVDRVKALDKIRPFQKDDFKNIFRALNGKPANIRLLDPPLHEFLPKQEDEKTELGETLGIDLKTVNYRLEQLIEANPMLGHRGCRLGITFPEIYRMQVNAIIEAALEVSNEGIKVTPEIMIPLIFDVNEFTFLKKELNEEIELVFQKFGKRIDFKLGTMIEIPRAALTIKSMAKELDFISFGTNDLTQTTFGISRDDSPKFLSKYIGLKIIKEDPFVVLDQEGVGQLVQMAHKGAKEINPKIHSGICGEHGGEPHSVEFFHKIGLDYVSCSPFRVPIARLAAAQAALMDENKES